MYPLGCADEVVLAIDGQLRSCYIALYPCHQIGASAHIGMDTQKFNIDGKDTA